MQEGGPSSLWVTLASLGCLGLLSTSTSEFEEGGTVTCVTGGEGTVSSGVNDTETSYISLTFVNRGWKTDWAK